MFPSHIGSRSTKPHQQPHVFVAGFHPTLVLAQQGRTIDKGNRFTRFHPTLVLAQRGQDPERDCGRDVSIPHWFSLNVEVEKRFDLVGMFPSHIGSRSTDSDITLVDVEILFPSHIGSRSTGSSGEGVFIFAFPSHIGSRSTTR